MLHPFGVFVYRERIVEIDRKLPRQRIYVDLHIFYLFVEPYIVFGTNTPREIRAFGRIAYVVFVDKGKVVCERGQKRVRF